ncbi:MAG: GIY-YIG nuclease family protein [Phycisphaerales bacterium]|nr:GIY-YIG nuclease family protein [Phycisphaerales bacterium]
MVRPPHRYRRVRLPRFYCYLLLSERGEIYCGFTSNLRRRLREHNEPSNRGWTRGRRWHLLAVKRFLDRDSALLYERWVKRRRWMKTAWIRRSRVRLQELCRRHGIEHRLA